MNFAGIMIPTDKAETEAFQASEGLNASRIRVTFIFYYIPGKSQLPPTAAFWC
jgi:hypothetical protein